MPSQTDLFRPQTGEPAADRCYRQKALKTAFKCELVTHLITTFGLRLRQAYRSLNLSRTVYHFRPDTTRDEPVIVTLQAVAERYPRYGFPKRSLKIS